MYAPRNRLSPTSSSIPQPWPSRSQTLLCAIVGLSSPVLLFPDFAPASWRWPLVTTATLLALGLGIRLCHDWKAARRSLWLFGGAVTASWLLMRSPDLGAMRHFGGVGLAVLTMGVVARFGTSQKRLLWMALLVALVGAGILAIGLPAAAINIGKFAGGTGLLSDYLVARLPAVRIDLPGIASGRVNPNALAATGLLFLPLGLAVAACGIKRQRIQWLPAIAGSLTSLAAVLVLTITRSRTSLVALALTALVVNWHRRNLRSWICIALAVGVAGAIIAGWRVYEDSPQRFADTVQTTKHQLLQRAAIWQQGIDGILANPAFGIGFNQFHEVRLHTSVHSPAEPVTHVAHAHNIFIQVALDIGVPGLFGYVWFFALVLRYGWKTLGRQDVNARLAMGATYSLIAVHFFGLGDAIALGAKVGLFQWVMAGLVLAAAHPRFEAIESSPSVSEPGDTRP